MSKELISRLYSTEADVRREAVYRILFDRRHDLIDELKQAAFYEQNEDIALLIAQVAMTLEAFPRDHSLERQIVEDITRAGGITEMSRKMWDYLITHGNSEMLIAVMGAMGEMIPPQAQEFMESCLNHADPEIRAMACGIAINSGRPTHFAHVLNLITDKDPMVAEAAFRVVRELPADQMIIILDYALGSPDEWVLQNVAPFLPLLINNDLRKVISKVQYHAHPLVSKKAREALKHLDSIPYVSKRKKEKGLEDDGPGNEGENGSGSGEKTEEKLSFKEQMEEKRRKRMEEEQRKREEDERIAAELEQTGEDELEELSQELEQFEQEATGISSGDSESVPAEDEQLVDNLDFENELAVLEDVDENVDFDKIQDELDQAVEDDLTDENALSMSEEQSIVAEEGVAEAEIDLEAAAAEAETIEFEESAEQLAIEEVTPVTFSIEEKPAEELEKEEAANEGKNLLDEIENIEVQEVELDIEVEDLSENDEIAPPEIATAAAKESPKANELADAQDPEAGVSPKEAAPAPATAPARPKKVEETIPEGAIKIPLIPMAQTILTRYPSFLTEPFANLFRPARPEVHLKNLQLTADNLTAYLNLCFLQSCMFFAPASEVLNKSVKECLKGHLTGPTALRCLHNFALAMKQSRENPVFFTFSLANILTESSETNPVMMLRELKEYLKEPIQPLEESLPQAVEGLAEILRGVKAILNNLIVMKAPKGAKEPFADLSGPLAQVLAADKRPAIELPAGEAVVLSRDGSEAFGLFPYFKYAKRKLFFSRPDPAEFKILLERLEIEL